MVHSLAALLQDYQITSPKSLDLPITGLCIDSRLAKKGEVFLAYPGEHTDGRHYISAALEHKSLPFCMSPVNYLS